MLRTPQDVDDLFETRVILETELVALCAHRASGTDLEQIEALVLEMERTMDHPVEDFASLDIQFHSAIAEGSKNRILGRLFQSIHGLIKEMLTKREYILGGHEEACKSHRKILQALKQRKVREARRAMREHLDGFIANFLREHLAASRPKDKARAAGQEPLPPIQGSGTDARDAFLDPGPPSVVVPDKSRPLGSSRAYFLRVLRSQKLGRFRDSSRGGTILIRWTERDDENFIL